MIHCPSGYPSNVANSGYSNTQVSNRTESSSSVVTENADGSRSTVSARLTTSYSYSETRYSPHCPAPSVTYQPPSYSSSTPMLSNTESSGTNGAVAIAGVNESTNSNNPGAATILAFIEQQLVADVNDGASDEALQSRLQAGFEGFIKGFTEAAEQLKLMGLYEGAVQSAVEETFNQVVNGIAEMSEQYGLENPAADIELFDPIAAPPVVATEDVTQEPITNMAIQPQEFIHPFAEKIAQNRESQNFATLIEPSQNFYAQLDKEESASRLYSFQLRTNDGDVVTIRSYSDQGERVQNMPSPMGSVSQTDKDGMDDVQFSVEGELDADEMRAITELLAQINDVAETFFGGDVYKAYESALDIGFDSDEIARFSLNLTQMDYSRIESAYGTVAAASSDQLSLSSGPQLQTPTVDNRVARMSDFIQQLETVRERAGTMGFSPNQLPAMAEFMGRPQFGHHPHFPQYPPFLGQMFGALDKAHA